MTNEMMSLCALIEKSDNTDFLREMIGLTAERLMELEVAGKTGAAYGEKNRSASLSATASAISPGTPAPVRSSCASPSCAREAIFRAFSSRAGWPRRR